MEVLDHLRSCTGFLYIIKSLRTDLIDATESLTSLSNSRERDISIKSAISTLKLIEQRYAEYVQEVNDIMEDLDEQEHDFEEDM